MSVRTTTQELLIRVDCLCTAWCDRRCLTALRHLLRAWRLSYLLTDSWGELGIALKNIRAFAHNEITAQAF